MEYGLSKQEPKNNCKKLKVNQRFTVISFHGLLVPRTELFRYLVGEKNESSKQISGSERNNFLYLERNDHGTKRPNTKPTTIDPAEQLQAVVARDSLKKLSTVSS